MIVYQIYRVHSTEKTITKIYLSQISISNDKKRHNRRINNLTKPIPQIDNRTTNHETDHHHHHHPFLFSTL